MKHLLNLKRTVTAILAMAMLVTSMLACLVSCADNELVSDIDTTDVLDDITTADVTTTVAETAYIDTLEKRDMGNLEIIFYGQNLVDRQNFYMEEKIGDRVNDTMHERDVAVEEHLNVTLTFISEGDRSVVKNTAKNSSRSVPKKPRLLSLTLYTYVPTSNLRSNSPYLSSISACVFPMIHFSLYFAYGKQARKSTVPQTKRIISA